MLTRKQFELLRFIHERLKEAGVPPSFDEMKDALDLRSKSPLYAITRSKLELESADEVLLTSASSRRFLLPRGTG